MSRSEQVGVVDKNGLRGRLDVHSQLMNGGEQQVAIHLDSGQRVLVPVAALVELKDGGYFLPISLAALERQHGDELDKGESIVVPVLEEELEVHRRRIETGKVRITKRVSEREETIDEPILAEEVDVRRVAVNRVVDTPPQIRQEGGTMVIPVLEEVLVIEKRLMLKEELHISKRQVERHAPQQVTLRSEEVAVERLDSQEE